MIKGADEIYIYFCGDFGIAGVPPPYVVIDEVQVVSRCDGHGASSPLGQPGVGLVQRLVNVHKGVDDGLPVGGWLGQVGVDRGDKVGNVLEGGRGRGEGRGREGYGIRTSRESDDLSFLVVINLYKVIQII